MGIIFSEGSGVNDSIYGKCQTPIKIFMEKRTEAFENESVIEKIFSMQKSKHFAEKATGMTSMQGFEPVGEGGAYPKSGMQEGYGQTFEHNTWKNSFAITQEMAEDSVLMNLKKRPAAFLNGYHRTRELFGAALVGGAISGKAASFGGHTFKTSANDGLSLFNAAHPSITGGCETQANKFTNAFSNDMLGKIETEMQNFKDDNGNILAVTPDTIVIPNDAELKKDVFAAIGADKDPATANNGFNYTFGRWRVIVWAYLNQYIAGGAKPWILMSSQYNEDYGGALWYDRRELTLKSYIDENTDDNVWKGSARWSAGFNDWRAFAVGGASDGITLT